MNFRLITVAAAEGLRAQANLVEVSQYGHYHYKMNLWVVCRRRGRHVWSTWLYV